MRTIGMTAEGRRRWGGGGGRERGEGARGEGGRGKPTMERAVADTNCQNYPLPACDMASKIASAQLRFFQYHLTLTLALSLSVCLSVCLSLSLSHTHTHTHARTHARTHTRTHARTHARTHTHTYTTFQPTPPLNTQTDTLTPLFRSLSAPNYAFFGPFVSANDHNFYLSCPPPPPPPPIAPPPNQSFFILLFFLMKHFRRRAK